MNKFDSPRLTLPEVMDLHAKWRPDKTAIICGDRRISYGELSRGINRTANALIEAGLKKGDKVSVLSQNSVEMAEVIFGALRAGGVIVPLSAMVQGEGLAVMINDSDSKFLFADGLMSMVISPFRDRIDDVRPDGFISLGFEGEG
jgi:acyl-CoA synthetase (AMP-forming)/AMP-acid ligase II